MSHIDKQAISLAANDALVLAAGTIGLYTGFQALVNLLATANKDVLYLGYSTYRTKSQIRPEDVRLPSDAVKALEKIEKDPSDITKEGQAEGESGRGLLSSVYDAITGFFGLGSTPPPEDPGIPQSMARLAPLVTSLLNRSAAMFTDPSAIALGLGLGGLGLYASGKLLRNLRKSYIYDKSKDSKHLFLAGIRSAYELNKRLVKDNIDLTNPRDVKKIPYQVRFLATMRLLNRTRADFSDILLPDAKDKWRAYLKSRQMQQKALQTELEMLPYSVTLDLEKTAEQASSADTYGTSMRQMGLGDFLLGLLTAVASYYVLKTFYPLVRTTTSQALSFASDPSGFGYAGKLTKQLNDFYVNKVFTPEDRGFAVPSSVFFEEDLSDVVSGPESALATGQSVPKIIKVKREDLLPKTQRRERSTDKSENSETEKPTARRSRGAMILS